GKSTAGREDGTSRRRSLRTTDDAAWAAEESRRRGGRGRRGEHDGALREGGVRGDATEDRRDRRRARRADMRVQAEAGRAERGRLRGVVTNLRGGRVCR